MPNVITIDVLRQVANNSISIYDALKRAQTFTEESKQILTMTEDLLHEVGLAYLTEIPMSKPASANNISSAREEMISSYIAIQKSYADLGDALYRLANALIGAGVADKACIILEALLKIDPNYRNVADILRQSLLDQAKALFEQKKWEEGRTILKQRPLDKEMRLAYLSSFLDESRFEMFENGIQLHRRIFALEALQQKEPRVNELLPFQSVLNAVDALRCAEREVYFIEEDKRTTWYEVTRNVKELRSQSEQRGMDRKKLSDATHKWHDTRDQFRESLYALETSLTSII